MVIASRCIDAYLSAARAAGGRKECLAASLRFSRHAIGDVCRTRRRRREQSFRHAKGREQRTVPVGEVDL
jgi:hypothetical protein